MSFAYGVSWLDQLFMPSHCDELHQPSTVGLDACFAAEYDLSALDHMEAVGHRMRSLS
jgi:hypothetical protein